MAAFDDVVQMLGGTPSAPSATSNPQGSKYGTPPEILDRLEQTESSGNPKAVNAKTGAMGAYQFMPGTVQMLANQGVKFDPFDPQQARDAADFYIQQLKQQNGGDLNKALAAYGGFKTQDPSNYVAKVTGLPQQQGGQFSDVIGLLNGTEKAPQVPIQVAQQAQQDKASKAYADAQERGKGLDELLANQVTGLGATIVGGWKGLAATAGALMAGKGLSEAAQEGGQAVNDYTASHTYQPQTQAGQQDVSAFNSGYNPLTWIPRAGNYVGEKTAEVTGSPALGATANAAFQVLAPVAVGKGVAAVRGAMAAPTEVTPATPLATQTAEAAKPAITEPAPANDVTQVFRDLQQKGIIKGQESAPATATAPAAADEAAAKPQLPQLAVSSEQQMQRAQVLRELGIENARQSAVSGDPKAAATDWQMSRVDGPAGDYLKQQFDQERAALQNYSNDIVQKTGGTPGLAQDDLYARGQTILQPLDALRQWFDSRTKALYQEADARSQGVPTSLDSFRTVLGDDSLMTNSDRLHLRDAVAAYAKKLGISADENGVFANGQQAETLRKYLNENWSPQNAGYVSALKNALDDDVLQAAGEDVYGAARQMRAMRGATLDNPNGVAKIIDADGINRKVNIEGIPNAVASMPVDQFQHVVNTLNNVPSEIQPQAQAALNEIKAQFANKLDAIGNSQAGQWNAKGVGEYLKANNARMSQVFTPEEMQRFDTLRQGGEILRTPQSYPGAFVQKANIGRAGMGAALRYGSTAAGGAVGSVLGPVGTAGGGAIGQAVGSKLASRVEQAGALKAAQKRVIPISSLLETK